MDTGITVNGIIARTGLSRDARGWEKVLTTQANRFIGGGHPRRADRIGCSGGRHRGNNESGFPWEPAFA